MGRRVVNAWSCPPPLAGLGSRSVIWSSRVVCCPPVLERRLRYRRPGARWLAPGPARYDGLSLWLMSHCFLRLSLVGRGLFCAAACAGSCFPLRCGLRFGRTGGVSGHRLPGVLPRLPGLYRLSVRCRSCWLCWRRGSAGAYRPSRRDRPTRSTYSPSRRVQRLIGRFQLRCSSSRASQSSACISSVSRSIVCRPL